jgi:hypothetical protein
LAGPGQPADSPENKLGRLSAMKHESLRPLLAALRTFVTSPIDSKRRPHKDFLYR